MNTGEQSCSCGASVWFLRHERTGKVAPINVAPTPGGNIAVDLATCVYRLIPACDRQEGALHHTNHFMDCPVAAVYTRHGSRNETQNTTHPGGHA